MIKKKLGDLATYINGYAFKPTDWGEKGLPIIRIQDLTGTSYQLNYYDRNYPQKIQINDGDVLISWSASLGVYIWNKGKALLNQHIFKVVFDKVEIDKGYFAYAVKYNLINMGARMHGATMKHIVKKDFDNIDIPYPSLALQREMSKVFGTVEKVMEKRRCQLKELDNLIKSRFVEMFGNPILNPMKWEVKQLKSLSSKILSGNTPKGGSQVYVNEGIKFFRSQNVWKNHIDMDEITYIDNQTHKKMAKSSLKHQDILMTKTGRINTENSSLGRAAMYMGEDDQANINGHVYLIRLNEDAVKEFILFILTTIEYRDYIRSVCVGGIDKRQLNKEHIEEFPIIFPPKEKQEEFTALLKQVDKSKSLLHQSLKELEEQFNCLMQKAFNGDLFPEE